MIDKSPLVRYHERYKKIKQELGITPDKDSLLKLIETNPSGLNNFYMAAMGMSTLIVRLGAIIQLCRKLKDDNTKNDALFMKQVIDNLRETLPSDTNWRELWKASMQIGSEWEKPCIQKNGDSLLSRFVTFRNKFAHQIIRIIPADIDQLTKSISIFDEMEQLNTLFKDSSIEEKEGKFYFIQANKILELHPFIQKGKNDDLPYLFQGMYENKKNTKLINTHLGNELEQESQLHLEPLFNPLRQAIRGGAGEVFDHSVRLAYYQNCFFGRERERNLILEWCKTQGEQNILPVYSNAGMGKGALIADVIEKLQKEKIPVLYHFCGAGIQNSLHATLYHFILQGAIYKAFNGISFWDNKNEEIKKKLERLPTKYIEVIHLFQNLLSNYGKVNLVDLEATISKMRASNNLIALMGIYDSNNMIEETKSVCAEILLKDPANKQALEKLKNVQNIKKNKNLVIIIDGLDEAAVANSSLHISDWFYTYNEKEEPENDWRSPLNIRWIFTYRKTDGQKGYQFPFEKEGDKIESLQPLLGLSESSVDAALEEFKVSADFKKEVIRKGAIV